MPMTSKLFFLFKRKSLALNLLQTHRLQGHRLCHIATNRVESVRGKTKDSIGKKERSTCEPNTLSGPCVATEKALSLPVSGLYHV